MEYGQLNCERPAPSDPVLPSAPHVEVKTWRRLCLVSATQMFPVAWSTATPRGQLKEFGDEVRWPHVPRIEPSVLFIRTICWLTVSATARLPEASKPIPRGSLKTAVAVSG